MNSEKFLRLQFRKYYKLQCHRRKILNYTVISYLKEDRQELKKNWKLQKWTGLLFDQLLRGLKQNFKTTVYLGLQTLYDWILCLLKT